MPQQDYYQVLGVTSDASSTELRDAYVRLIRQHHPDTAGHLPHRLREVQQAYRCLSDAANRAAHDRTIHETRRAHLVQQRSIRRRLSRYDRRHPHLPPGTGPYRRWRWWLIVGAAAAAAFAIAATCLAN